MRLSALSIALCAVACESGDRVVHGLPTGMSSAIVLRGSEAWLIEGDARWEATSDGRPVTVLFYPGSTQSMGLEVADGNVLVRAGPTAAPEDVYSLPAPESGAVFDPIRETFDAITDPALLASAAAAIRVPAPPCGQLVVSRADPLGVDIGDATLQMPALVDGVTMFPTAAPLGAAQLARLFRIEHGVARDLTPQLLPRPEAQLRVFADGDAFFAVQIDGMSAASYRIALDGTATLLNDVAMTRSGALAETVHWPGSHSLIGRDSDTRTLDYFDADTGVWQQIDALASPADPRCTPYLANQALVLEGPTRGINAFVDVPPQRFVLGGQSVPVTPGEQIATCQSGYVRFGFGAELSVVLADVLPNGAYDIRSAWRTSADDPWQRGDFPAPMFGLSSVGEDAVGIDPVRDDVVLVSRDPRRPDQRPRLCARLGLASVQQMAMQGSMGVVLLREDARARVSVALFEIGPP